MPPLPAPGIAMNIDDNGQEQKEKDPIQQKFDPDSVNVYTFTSQIISADNINEEMKSVVLDLIFKGFHAEKTKQHVVSLMKWVVPQQIELMVKCKLVELDLKQYIK